MHAAPAVSVCSRGAGWWRAFNVLLPALATAALCAWLLAHAQRPVWPAVLLVPCTALLLWLLVKPLAFDVRWDGERWLAPGPDQQGEEGRLDVMLDLGSWLLLRWRPSLSSRRGQWFSVRATEARPDLHALRAAVYCRRPEPTPSTGSGPTGRQAAEPD
jgi:hypothetical protein